MAKNGPTRDYHEAFVAHAKKQLSGWQFDRLHQKARATAGGKGKAARRIADAAAESVTAGAAGVIPGSEDPILETAFTKAAGPDDPLLAAALEAAPVPLVRNVADAVAKKALRPRPLRVKKRHIKPARVALAKQDARMVGTNGHRQLVYCVALEPHTVDTQGDVIEPEEIEFSAHHFMRNARAIHKEHQSPIDATPVESYIAPMDLAFEDGPFGGQVVTKGSWVIGIHVNDKAEWQRVLDGEYTGVSVGGYAVRSAAD